MSDPETMASLLDEAVRRDVAAARAKAFSEAVALCHERADAYAAAERSFTKAGGSNLAMAKVARHQHTATCNIADAIARLSPGSEAPSIDEAFRVAWLNADGTADWKIAFDDWMEKRSTREDQTDGD